MPRPSSAAHDRVIASVNRPEAGPAPITWGLRTRRSPRAPNEPSLRGRWHGRLAQQRDIQRGRSTAPIPTRRRSWPRRGRTRPRRRRRGAGVQVETAASTTGAVVGTRFDVPLATRVEERVSAGLPASAHASPAGARRPRAGRWYISTFWARRWRFSRRFSSTRTSIRRSVSAPRPKSSAFGPA
jgi:hypothetical protein